MTVSLTRFDALAQTDLPVELRQAAPRPFRGTFFRWGFAASLVLAGLASRNLPAGVTLALLGLAIFWIAPKLVDRRLAKLEREVDRLDGAQASALLRALPDNRVVALFAPFAWVTWQRARLHLRLGDPKAAAHAFREAARQSGRPDHPALRSALAHALTLAGELREARELLGEVQRQHPLQPRDHLNLGVALVSESGRVDDALEHLQRAVASLPAEPRAQAALALALAKRGDLIEAQAAYDAATAVGAVDAQTDDLLKRARKTLRKVDAPQAAGTKGQGPSTRKRGKGKKASRPAAPLADADRPLTVDAPAAPQRVAGRVTSSAKTRARFSTGTPKRRKGNTRKRGKVAPDQHLGGLAGIVAMDAPGSSSSDDLRATVEVEPATKHDVPSRAAAPTLESASESASREAAEPSERELAEHSAAMERSHATERLAGPSRVSEDSGALDPPRPVPAMYEPVTSAAVPVPEEPAAPSPVSAPATPPPVTPGPAPATPEPVPAASVPDELDLASLFDDHEVSIVAPIIAPSAGTAKVEQPKVDDAWASLLEDDESDPTP